MARGRAGVRAAVAAVVVLAGGMAHGCPPGPGPSGPPAQAWRVTDFGAAPDDDRPDDEAIGRALAALPPGGWLVFPPGRYLQARSLAVAVPGATIWGPGATLHATDPADHALALRADGVRLIGLTLTAVTDHRRSTPAQARVSIHREGPAGAPPLRGIEVRGVRVEGAGSVGILVHGAADFTVTASEVRGTLADGIHVTGGSRHGRVVGNRVRDTGDDLISVVSYDDAPPVTDVRIADNDVAGTAWGRGLSVVGGRRITLAGNRVADVARAAGILVAREGNWHTRPVEDVRVEGNRLARIQVPPPGGAVPRPTGHAAIEVHVHEVPEGEPGVGDVTIEGNAVTASGAPALRLRAGRRVPDAGGARLDCAALDAAPGLSAR